MLPIGVHVLTEDQRDWDDSYWIASGNTFCFEFIIPQNQVMVIDAIHSDPTAQDLSLRCWFSNKAYGDQYFPLEDNMDVFPLVRAIRSIRLGTFGSDEALKVPGDTIMYMMVKNLQNRENRFKLMFRIPGDEEPKCGFY